MKTWIVAAVAAGVLVIAGLPALAVTLASNDSASGVDRTERAGQHPGKHKHADKRADKRADKARGKGARDRSGRRGDGQGPPPWAHRHGPKAGPGAEWRKLTAQQRAEKMAELAKEHAQAMQKWADCLAAGKTDCVRPLPPGLAKRR